VDLKASLRHSRKGRLISLDISQPIKLASTCCAFAINLWVHARLRLATNNRHVNSGGGYLMYRSPDSLISGEEIHEPISQVKRLETHSVEPSSDGACCKTSSELSRRRIRAAGQDGRKTTAALTKLRINTAGLHSSSHARQCDIKSSSIADARKQLRCAASLISRRVAAAFRLPERGEHVNQELAQYKRVSGHLKTGSYRKVVTTVWQACWILYQAANRLWVEVRILPARTWQGSKPGA